MQYIGYARVSTMEQHLDVQLAKLTAAGCEPIFQEKRSGTDDKRPVLAECLRYVRTGEALVVTRLDRLARSLHHLCTIAKDLEQRGVHLIVLDQQIGLPGASAGKCTVSPPVCLAAITNLIRS